MYVLNPTNPHIDLLLKYCLGGGAWARGTYSVIPLAFCVPLLGDLALRCENHVLSGHSCQWRPPHVCGLWLTKNHTSYNLELFKPFFSNHPVPKQGLPLAPIWRKWSKPCPLGVEKAPLLYVANLKVGGEGWMTVRWPASPSRSDAIKLYLQIPDPKFPQVAKQKRQSTPSSPLWKQCAVTLITVSKQSVFAWKEAA